MAKHELVIIADPNEITLQELCEICSISSDFISHLMEYEIIHPKGREPEEWVFDLAQLQRIKKAVRLQRDLDVNLAGVAVVLDLMEELQELRAEVELIHKHVL